MRSTSAASIEPTPRVRAAGGDGRILHPVREPAAAPPGTAVPWPSATDALAVTRELADRPPLVDLASCWELRARLSEAAYGRARILQAGDCAEQFREVSPTSTRRKHSQLAELGRLITEQTGHPTVLIGRLAGQFAKPRSCATEPGPDGTPLPVYRGDAVNEAAADPAARIPDPRRMLAAYRHAAAVLDQLAVAPSADGRLWVSHEALLLEYEEPLVRIDPLTHHRFASSGHLVWVGERTRAPHGPHVRLLAGVVNPIGLKLGPDVTDDELTELIETLDPYRQPGRLVLIPRLGHSRVHHVLPRLVSAVARTGARPVWLCDPMHGNTIKLPDGRKTRVLEELLAEVRGFVSVLAAAGQHPAGLHLETTPDAVTECVADRAELRSGKPLLPRYRTACDPRLTTDQARQLTQAFLTALPDAGIDTGSLATAPVLGDDSLRPGDVSRLARTPGARPALSQRARLAMARSVDLRDAMIAAGEPLYGVTTGFGDSSTNPVPAHAAADLQRNLIRYHLVGSGPLASADTVRATMLIRANCLARGYSGIRAEIVDLLLDMVGHDIVPEVPERGSVGASGDLVPLSYLAEAVTGGGRVRHRGTSMPTREALEACGLQPAELGPKEALALINGTSFMSAFAVLAAADASELAHIAEASTALAVEAVCGHSDAFAPFAHDHKPHPGQRHSAAAVARLVRGSQLVRPARTVAAAAIGEQPGRTVQDRYSLRCAPQVIGVLRDTLSWVDQWLGTEICSTNDNPIFDPAERTVHNAGNFYGGHVAMAMDSLKVAVASVADLLDRQLASIVDARFSNGLPANLTPADPGGRHVDHGFKGVQIAASALTAEALKLGTPATAFSRSTEAHNQDKVSMGTIAARDARTVVDLTFDLSALHLAALCQAVELRGVGRLGAGSRSVFDAVRRHIGFLSEDRPLGLEIAALSQALRAGLISTSLHL